jgi:hypothetical protein
MDDLFSPTDPDLIAYQQGSQEYYLRVASATIRTYLGWHLSPSITDLKDVQAGAKGITMLPSRHVTEVYHVTMIDAADMETLVDPDSYWWDEQGYIEFNGYGPPLGQRLRVKFQHGYKETPLDVKAVAFELIAANGANSPDSGSGSGGGGGYSGPVKGMTSPGGYSVDFSAPSNVPFYGMNLNSDQMKRLSAYRLSEVK